MADSDLPKMLAGFGQDPNYMKSDPKDARRTQDMVKSEIMQRLRESKASWETAKTTTSETSAIDRSNIRKWEPVSFQAQQESTAFTPSTLADELPAAAAAAATNEYSFELELDSIDNDAFTVDIHVGYGEINDTPPDGMTGADDFIFTIPGADSGVEIYAVITYDTSTLDITSRSLAFAFSVPDSTYGTLYVPIGFVDISYSDMGAIAEVNPHNRHCGDINVAFIYGALNGAPALYTLSQFADPVLATF